MTNIEFVDYEVGPEPGGVAWLLVNDKELTVFVHEDSGDKDFHGWHDLSIEEQDDVGVFLDSEEFTKAFPIED